MKRLMAAALSAALVLTPVSSQAFLPVEDIVDYKLHLLDCFGLMFQPGHDEECGGGPVDPALKSLSDPVPGAPPVVVEDCYSNGAYILLRKLPVGDRIRVATDC